MKDKLAAVLGTLLGVALFVPIVLVLGCAKVICVVFDWLEGKRD